MTDPCPRCGELLDDGDSWSWCSWCGWPPLMQDDRQDMTLTLDACCRYSRRRQRYPTYLWRPLGWSAHVWMTGHPNFAS